MSYYGNIYIEKFDMFHSNDFSNKELKDLFTYYQSIEIERNGSLYNSYYNYGNYIIKNSAGGKEIPHAQFYIMIQRLRDMPSVPLNTFIRLFNTMCSLRKIHYNNKTAGQNLDEILGLLLESIIKLNCSFSELEKYSTFIANIEQQSLRFSTAERSVVEEHLQNLICKLIPDMQLYHQVLSNDHTVIDKLAQESRPEVLVKNRDILIILALKLKDNNTEMMKYILKKILLVHPIELRAISKPFLDLLLSNISCAEDSTFKKEWLEVLLKNAISDAGFYNSKIWQWIKNTEGGIDFVKEYYPVFWVNYLTTPIYCINSVDYPFYLDSLAEICRDHMDIFKIILIQEKCCNTVVVSNLLKAAEKHSDCNINLAIFYIFYVYESNGTLFLLVNEYFKCRSTQNPLIIPRIEEEAFVEKNLFKLLNSCVKERHYSNYSSVANGLLDLLIAELIKRSSEKCFSQDEFKSVFQFILKNKVNHPKLNELLIAELIKRSSGNGFSGDEFKLNFEFILQNEIQQPQLILILLDEGMKMKFLSVENIKRLVKMLVKNNDNSLLIFTILEQALDAKLLGEKDIQIFAKMAIEYSNVSLLRKILNKYGEGLKSVIDNALTVKSGQSVNSRRIIGLLYAYKNNQLPKIFEFDFLLEAYCEHSYDIWKASNGADQTIVLTIKADIGESSYIEGAKEAIWKTAGAKFPDINPRESYQECLQYIKTELVKLEGHARALDNPAARDNFIPDQFGGKVDPAVAKMTDAQIKIARYHTALRLLKRDRNDVEYIYNESYFDGFDETVGYCYEIAKKAGCLDAFIQALVDIRRGHNIDNINNKARCQTRKDYPSCSSGAPGRLYQAYVLHFNLILEQERAKQQHVLQEFNTALMNEQIKDFVLKIVSEATRNFVGNAQHHLALLIYHYQACTLYSNDDESKENAEKAIEYILEDEMDYLQLYKQLAGPYVTKTISACPAEVKKALKDIIAYQLRVLFLINDPDPKRPHLESMLWNTLPQEVIEKTYPAILLHFLAVPPEPNNPKPVHFNDLVTVAAMMPPLVLDEFRERLIADLPTLARFFVRKHSKEESGVFVNNMKSLLNNGVISVDNINSFFKEFFVLAAREDRFDKKVIVLLEVSKDIFGDVLKAGLKDAIQGLLTTVHYKQYRELRNLIKYALDNALLSKDYLAKIIQQQAQQLIVDKNYTACLRLTRFASRLDICIELQNSAVTRVRLGDRSKYYISYDRKQDNAIIRKIQDTVTSKVGSLATITEDRKTNFAKLEKFSAEGNSYASFVMAQLYYDKQAISINSSNEAQWIENRELAIIYASIAIQQAKVMRDSGLEKEIWLFFEKNLSSEEFSKLNADSFNLEELYYTYMLKLLNVPESADFLVKLENFLLIAKSVDLGQLLHGSEYTSDNKTAVLIILGECSAGKDLSKADVLQNIYDRMEQEGCYIQSEGGTFYSNDPRIILPVIQFEKRYRSVLKALQKIVAEFPQSESVPIAAKDLCDKIAAEIGVDYIKLIEYLKHIYQYMLNSQVYQGNIKNLEKPEHEIIREILTEICKRSNIELSIVSISASAAVNNVIVVPKGKEEADDSSDKSKEKELLDESPLGLLQSQHQALHERLIGYPEVIETLLNMGSLINLMISLGACEEQQIRELRSYLVMIKISINEGHNLSREFKQEIDSLTDTMLVLLDNIATIFIPFDEEPFLPTENVHASTSYTRFSSSSSSSSGASGSSSSTSGPAVPSSFSSTSRPASSSSSSSTSGATASSSSTSRPAVPSSSTPRPAALPSSTSGPAIPPSNNSMGTRFMSAVRSGLNTFFTEPSQAREPRNTVDNILSDLVNVNQNPNHEPILERHLAGDTPLQAADSRKKILLIGDFGVGKSCLLLRLADNIYTDSYISTIGVDYKLHTATVCGQRFGVQIWDTCGQERFINIYGGAHRGADTIVICFDLTDRVSFYNVKKWMREVSHYAGSEKKVILIGTKCDLVNDRVVPYDEAKGLADAMGSYYLETSSKDSTNAERLEALIALTPHSQRQGNLDQASDYHIEGEEEYNNRQRPSYSRRG